MTESKRQKHALASVPPLKPFDYWSERDTRQSMQEGWLLTNDSKGRVAIARLDDPAAAGLDYQEPRFADDEEATLFVFAQQTLLPEGSRYGLAMWLVGAPVVQQLSRHPPLPFLDKELAQELPAKLQQEEADRQS